MTTDIERSLQRENVRLMIALSEVAENLAEHVGGNDGDLIDDALDRASEIVKSMPNAYVERLLKNQKIIREVTIDVGHID